MVKKIVLAGVIMLHGLHASDIFERKCVPCHKDLPTSLEQMFKEYLLIYSSEKFVKAGLKHYLRNPSKSISVMSDLFIDTYGIKDKTTLSPEELDEAIDIYWEKFKVFDKLK
ncbi:MAG: hypothetical protein L3J47_06785 [Sulfurovum sp.]|nr:hypothetical protein [Sulfurovum sp.]